MEEDQKLENKLEEFLNEQQDSIQITALEEEEEVTDYSIKPNHSKKLKSRFHKSSISFYITTQTIVNILLCFIHLVEFYWIQSSNDSFSSKVSKILLMLIFGFLNCRILFSSLKLIRKEVTSSSLETFERSTKAIHFSSRTIVIINFLILLGLGVAFLVEPEDELEAGSNDFVSLRYIFCSVAIRQIFFVFLYLIYGRVRIGIRWFKDHPLGVVDDGGDIGSRF